MEYDILERIFDGSIKPRDIKLSALESITKNFSDEQIIGQGGFGTVYKGVLRNGEVAVKRLRNNHTIDEKLFRREVNSLLNVSHKNIIRFLGFCSNTEHKAIEYESSGEYIYAEDRERILCFEYIKNGSLEKYIADELRGLQWDTRYLIIKGICEGLHYLHMKKHIIHMDLKPANILIADNMVAQITDFGLSRMLENSETRTTNRFLSLGYTAPEYLENGKMSVKSDVYSLGIIIVELVTGQRSIPDINNVLRRWRHRWHKSGKETPFRYQQIAKLIDIGLLCQERDPYKRPFISDIINVINELESADEKISNANEFMVGQIRPYSEDDMLGIEPLELCFPCDLNKKISCSIELNNETNFYFAFIIQTTSPLKYCIQPEKDIVPPRSNYSVNIRLQQLDHAPHDGQYSGDFIVRSTKVNESLKSQDITEDIFKIEGDRLVDEVNLTVTYKVVETRVDMPHGFPISSDKKNMHGQQESNVLAIEEETKISASISDEVIMFDPPELCFPLVPDKEVLSSIKIINITESYVSFMLSFSEKNTGIYYHDISVSILQPRSTQCLTIIRGEKEDVVEDLQFNEEVLVWYAIVPEDIEVGDLDWADYYDFKNLPIILTKGNSCPSNDLIQFDPPELYFPCLNKKSVSSVNIVNVTDYYIGFNTWNFLGNIQFFAEPRQGIMPPRSTQRILVKMVLEENETEDMQCENSLFVWNMIVAEGVEASELMDYMYDQDSKKVPLIIKNTSPCTSDELVRFDHPGLCFNVWQDKIMMTSVNIVNVTDYYIGFHLFDGDTNAVHYNVDHAFGILRPRDTQRLVITRLILEKKQEGVQYQDRFYMWNSIVNEGIKASDLDDYMPSKDQEQSDELPIILNKITSSTLVEIIKLEPPEIHFPFLPSKILSSSINIVNVTDYHIGFNTHVEETNVALYTTDPPCGILPPWSAQEVVVTRVATEEALELEDIQCKDKYFVWSTFVTENVKASDMKSWMPKSERKEVPIVFTETSSDELIRFDPPEFLLPLIPNHGMMFSVKIINITNECIGYRICNKKSNSARYNVNPSEGILPPLSMQLLLVTSVALEKELGDTQCKDKILVWNRVVAEDVKASDVLDNIIETKITEFPIVLTKEGPSISDELIQFDPPGFHFPSLPNKVLSSFKIVNLTDYNVGFNTYTRPENVAWYHTDPPRGILPPRSTKTIMVTREEKEGAITTDQQLNDKYFVWKSIVSEGVKESDLSDCVAFEESKDLPIVLDKRSSSTSSELIQLDPTELSIPLFLNKRMFFKVNVVNMTDYYLAFNVYIVERNAPRCEESLETGILPPRSTKKVVLLWVTTETEFEDMVPPDDYFVWSRVVTEAVQSRDVISCMYEEESKHLPYILYKTSPCTSNELIQIDPPELNLLFRPNKSLVFSVNIVNNTDYYVCFNIYEPNTNVGWYYSYPRSGVMPPRSSQWLVVRWTRKKEEYEVMRCQDKFYIWNSFVSEDVEASEIVDCISHEGCKELPIVYSTMKTSLSVDELIQFDPPHLQFPFLPNKRVSMLRFFKIVNITDHSVGFNIFSHEENFAQYIAEPGTGILPPQSTQKIKVRRTLLEKEPEDMECKDKFFVWNVIVAEGVKGFHVNTYWKDEVKELPIVLTMPGEKSAM